MKVKASMRRCPIYGMFFNCRLLFQGGVSQIKARALTEGEG